MKKIVCIVEDDVVLSQMYRIKLEQAGYQVATFENGWSFLNFVARHRPSLVILDIMLPKQNGFVILKELRKDCRTRHLPVLILTNLAQADANLTDSLARSMGVVGYLVKSKTTPAHLLDRARYALGERRLA